MSRSLKYEVPGIDRRISPLDLGDKSWSEIFAGDVPHPNSLVLEIGFGRGEFLLELAAKNPTTAYVGVEVSFKRVLKMARKVGRAGLRNIRLIEARGEVMLREFFRSQEVSEIWINFSDPWPKDRHAHRRVVQPELVRDAADRLRPRGVLHIATDDVTYAEQIDSVLSGESKLQNDNLPEPWLADVPGRIPTGYELDWREKGRPLHFFSYSRRP